MELILETVVAAICLGILAQVVAQRFKLPAILPLLVLGMGAGPSGLGLFDPGALGHGLEVFVHLGVAVILFEGGLSLDIQRLRQVRGELRNLLVIGTLVTAVGGAVLAHRFAGASWSTAALFGAIVTVTGPTVIVPLLRHMVVPRRTRTLLLSEGLMIDPIGAVLAYFVLQWIERAGMDWRTLATEILTVSLSGAVLGFAAGALGILAARYRKLGGELRNLVILALLLGAFYMAERQASQSGVLAAVVMGLTLSAADLPDLHPLRAFKSQLTTLLISILFILLSGHLDLGVIVDLGLGGVWVVAGLILVVRPLAVLLSVHHSSWRERVVLGLTAPRGIVAAAVASVAAIELRQLDAPADAAALEGLVYLVILVSCFWATAMAPLLPQWLGYLRDPSRRRVVLVGAGSLSAGLARVFARAGWTAVVVDAVSRKLVPLHEEGIRTVCGDARNAETYEDAETERDSQVVALTANDELNVLVAQLVHEDFGVEHPVVALQQPSSELGSVRRAWVDILTGHGFDLPRWSRRLEDGKARLAELSLDNGERRGALRSLLREHKDHIAVLCSWKDGRPRFRFAPENVDDAERVTLIVQDKVHDLLEKLVAPRPENGADPATA